MYKKILILTLIIASSTMLAYAQQDPSHHEHRKEKLEQRKIAYISTELDMTADQAQRFWPIYNKYEALKKDTRPSHKKGERKKMNKLSEAEAEELISQRLDHEEQKLQWKRKFANELKDVLNNTQILKLLNAEREFRKEILDKYKKRRKKGMKKGQNREEKEK